MGEKTRVFQNTVSVTIQIALFGVLILVALSLIVMELFATGSGNLTVGDTVRVASSSLSAYNDTSKTYHTIITGTLTNESAEETFAVEHLKITGTDGKNVREVTVDAENIKLPPRFHRDFSAEFESDIEFDSFESVQATVNGKPVEVYAGAKASLGGALLFYAALLTVSVLLLVRACRIRYYLWQQAQNAG